jgi:hypothetical protein
MQKTDIGGAKIQRQKAGAGGSAASQGQSQAPPRSMDVSFLHGWGSTMLSLMERA